MSGKRILVVDDQRFMHQLIRPTLQAIGRPYEFLTTLRAAIESIEHGNVGLLICDIQLGADSGLDLVEEVRGIQNDARLPIIILTQYDDREMIDRAMTIGADDYITKPFKLQRITDAIKKWLVLEDSNFTCDGLSRDQARLARLTLATMGMSMNAARSGGELPYQMIRENWLSILQAGNDASVVAFLTQMKQKDAEIYKHCVKLSAHLGLMAAELGSEKDELGDIIAAGLLHDIGMARIPASLYDREWLTDEDHVLITRSHIENAKIIMNEQPPKSFPKIVREISMFHHERFDGSGPLGLLGTRQSTLVRAACIVEEFLERKDGIWLEPEQPYRILESMENDPGFDGELVKILKRSVKDRR